VSAPLGLGIDAGGSQTRWALAAAPGTIVAEGAVRGMSALQLHDGGALGEALSELASAALTHGRPTSVCAGFTGVGRDVDTLRALVGEPLDLAPEAITIKSDIEIAYLDIFAPGEGYVVYAGTGSVVAFIDESGVLHRAGGRGVAIDDGGGGYWIGREALRHVWRMDDESPGSWSDSPLAIALFEQIGGSGWDRTRVYVYEGDRGDVGRLALAVAKAAGEDPVARNILAAAGCELARLALAMARRHGARPVALTGRAARLHPLIVESMTSSLPPATPLELRVSSGHHAAARLALRATPD
jgi:N-acetylglucosamine kinase-like BadF-type ATPase